MIMAIRLLLTCMSILMALSAGAQTDAQLSHYFDVPSYYNPAAVGSGDMLKIRGGSRLQWVGVDNAPRTFIGVAEMPLRLGTRRLGVGAVLQQESMGLFRNLNVGAQIGYKLKFLSGTLTLGLQGGLLEERFNGSEIVLPDDDEYHQGVDEALPMRDVSGMTLDLSGGLYFERKSFWAGLSCMHFNSPTVTFASDDDMSGGQSVESHSRSYEYKAAPTLYFMAGCNIRIKNTLFEMIPSTMVKSDFTFTKIELTGRLRYNRFLSIGIGYRNDDAVIGLLSVEYKGVYIGYSYDYPTSDIVKASNGSHEIFAGYSLKLDFSEKNKHKQKSIRIM